MTSEALKALAERVERSMGTNYYVKEVEKAPCPTCGHKDDSEPLHIGKSSAGWKFLFAPYPELGLTSWAAWQAYLADKAIVDEYGVDVPLAELVDWVAKKQRDGMPASHPHDCERLDAEGYRFSITADFC